MLAATIAAFAAGIAFTPDEVLPGPADVRAQMRETGMICGELEMCDCATKPLYMLAHRIAVVGGAAALADVNAVARAAHGLHPDSYAALLIAMLETLHVRSVPATAGGGTRRTPIEAPVDSQFGPAARFH